jgi:hypothetical protein
VRVDVILTKGPLRNVTTKPHGTLVAYIHQSVSVVGIQALG